MCDPLTVGGMALSLAGTAVANRDAQKNMNRMAAARRDVALKELDRQKQYQEEAAGEFDTSLDRFRDSNTAKALTDATQNRVQQSEAAVQSGGYTDATGDATPTVVKSEIARKMLDASGRAKTTAQRLGKVQSFGDYLFDANSLLNLQGNRIGDINNAAAGSYRLLPLEQEAAANNVNKPGSAFGSLMKLAGTGASLAGFAGAGPSWGDLFGKFGSPYGSVYTSPMGDLPGLPMGTG